MEESRKLKPSGVSVNCVLVALLAVPAAFDEALELGLLGDLATCRLGLSPGFRLLISNLGDGRAVAAARSADKSCLNLSLSPDPALKFSNMSALK